MTPPRTTTKKPPSMTFEVTEQIKEDISHIQQKLKDETGIAVNQSEALAHIIKAYKQMQAQQKATSESGFNLSETETQLVEDAVTTSRMSLRELTKRGLLKEARTALTIAGKLEKESNASFEKLGGKQFNYKGVALKRVGLTVSRMMAYNDNYTEKKDKLFITETYVANVSGSNRTAIKQYFSNESNDDNIKSHNKQNDFDKDKDANHNRNLKLSVEEIRHKLNLTAHSVDSEMETSE